MSRACASTLGAIAAGHWARRYTTAAALAARRFTRDEAGAPWPGAGAFLDEDSRGRIRAIYRRDVEASARWL